MSIYDWQSFFHVSPVIYRSRRYWPLYSMPTHSWMLCLPSSAIWKSLFELLEEWMPFIYTYGASHVSSMLLCLTKPRPSGLKKLRYNPLCDAEEEYSSDMLSEELVTLTLKMWLIWKFKYKLWVKNRASKCRIVRECETSVAACWWVGRLHNGRQETQGIHIY
jgi:hypothetical protein